jgi:eukaryotic-like serine/threonine-protein kinase
MRILIITFIIIIYPFQSAYPQDVIKKIEDMTSNPALAWKFTLPAPVYSSPVIEGNIVYFGCLDSIFYALDLFTGKLRWNYTTGGSIRSTATIFENKIFFTSGDGKLYCLDPAGKLIWSFAARFDKQYDFADYFQSSPVISGNAIFFGSGDGYVYAVNLADGSLKWVFKAGDVVHATPAIDGIILYIGSFDGFVYALSVDDGNLLWKFKTVGHRYFPKGEVQGSPVVANGLVIVGARDYNVYALDAAKGFCHWNQAFSKGWVLSNTFHDSVLYMAGADERMLSATNPADGSMIWKKEMEFLQFGHPAFSQTMLYTGTTIGKLHGIDLKTGEKVWTYETEGYKANHLKYFKEDDSYRDDIYSIIKSNEQFLEVEMELGGIFSSPALANGYLVFTSTEGAAYCLRLVQK